jgi:hypothetical protein
VKNGIEYRPFPAVHTAVKTILPLIFRLRVFSLPLALALANSSCVTTYDPYGRPVQTVDPAVAVAGVAAAGLIGYAIGDSRGHHHRGGHYHHSGYCH